jgi:tripartite-type tricarboxylate transporter receptor subunit TctC
MTIVIAFTSSTVSASTGREPAMLRAAAVIVFAAPMMAAAAAGLPYPSKPIRIVASTTPGSGPDIIARLVGQKLTAAWGQPVVVDPRPGASGMIGAEIAARAAPDGYTLLVTTSQHAIVNAMYEKRTYDLVRDFSSISLMASTPFILVAHPSLAAASVKDLVALAKAKPRELKYGSGGSGSPPHLAAEIFKSMTGIEVMHVPYKGVTPALNDTVAGHVHLTFSVIPACIALVQSGKVKALGVTSAKRTSLVPDLPTLAESAPGYEFIGWYGLVAPLRTPAPVISKLGAEVVGALGTSDFQQRLSALGAEPIGAGASALDTFTRAQVEKMRKAVKASGARPDA